MSFDAVSDDLTSHDPRTGALPRAELLQLYEIAVREYQFNVRLGAQRQALYVALSAATTLAAHAVQLALAYAVAVLVSLAGAFVAHRSHRYYVAARQHFRRLEKELGLDARGLGLSTTPGMRGVGGRLTITRAAVALLLALAAIGIAGAAAALRAGLL